jgi:hypothetical protein
MWKIKSKQAIIVDNTTFLNHSFSLTALMNLKENVPIIFELYKDSNT